MANKRERQDAVLGLIDGQAIASQEELRVLLEGRGIEVTQATLSRDLRELGIVRAPGEGGARYVRPARLADEDKPKLHNILPHLFANVDGVGELLVIKTLPSGAQPVAEAVDAQGWSEIIGTLAGENTVLVICRSVADREELARRLIRIAEGD